MKEEKLQLGDVINSKVIGKSFKDRDLVLSFKKGNLEIKFKDALGLEIRTIPYVLEEC